MTLVILKLLVRSYNRGPRKANISKATQKLTAYDLTLLLLNLPATVKTTETLCFRVKSSIAER